MLLAIDAGNTRVKAAVFENDTLLAQFTFENGQFAEAVKKILMRYPLVSDMVVASVGQLKNEDFLAFGEKRRILFINRELRFPFENQYQTPETLGIDRLVLAAGAVLKYPGQHRLVIDAGTCVTYDFVTAGNSYLGGAISPGIRLRYEALHQYTARLPLLQKAQPSGIIGQSTQQSIHSGVVNGLASEIDGFIERYAHQYENFIIILTGGDAEFLAKQLKNTIFANQNFLLESLNQLFQYNQNDQKN